MLKYRFYQIKKVKGNVVLRKGGKKNSVFLFKVYIEKEIKFYDNIKDFIMIRLIDVYVVSKFY